MNTPQLPTPKTDEAVYQIIGPGTVVLNADDWQKRFGKLAAHARTLERELKTTREELAALKADQQKPQYLDRPDAAGYWWQWIENQKCWWWREINLPHIWPSGKWVRATPPPPPEEEQP